MTYIFMEFCKKNRFDTALDFLKGLCRVSFEVMKLQVMWSSYFNSDFNCYCPVALHAYIISEEYSAVICTYYMYIFWGWCILHRNAFNSICFLPSSRFFGSSVASCIVLQMCDCNCYYN